MSTVKYAGYKHKAREEREDVLLPSDSKPADAPFTERFSFRKFWAYTGPGWLMSIAYLDPGNIESDLQAGVIGGYSLIWVLFWATVVGFVLQVMAARLGVAAGRDLGQICREEYPRPATYGLWAMTEIAIIGSDIQEVVGSAIALNILFDLPLWAGVLITGFDTFTFLFLERFGVRKLEAFFAALILTMAVSFFAVFAIAAPAGDKILLGLVVPRVPRNAVVQAVAMIGAVIMPHNIYLHSSLVQSRGVRRSRRSNLEEGMYYFTTEAAISLLVSFFINAAIVSVFAARFYGRTECSVGGKMVDCTDIGLHEAGYALEVALHKSAKYVWAIGLLAAGQSSTMTGTYAGQFVMQGFLDLRIPLWKRTLITRSIAIVPAVLVAVLAQGELDHLDELLNVLQSLQLPFALIPVLKFAGSALRMGPHANNKTLRVMGWSLTGLVLVTNFYLVGQTLGTMTLPTGGQVAVYTATAIIGIPYFAFIIYILLRPVVGDPYVTVKLSSFGAPDESGTAGRARENSPVADTDAPPHETVEPAWWDQTESPSTGRIYGISQSAKRGSGRHV